MLVQMLVESVHLSELLLVPLLVWTLVPKRDSLSASLLVPMSALPSVRALVPGRDLMLARELAPQ